MYIETREGNGSKKWYDEDYGDGTEFGEGDGDGLNIELEEGYWSGFGYKIIYFKPLRYRI